MTKNGFQYLYFVSVHFEWRVFYDAKMIVIYMESGGFSERYFADVFIFKKRILLFNRKVNLLRNPFHNGVRHLE